MTYSAVGQVGRTEPFIGVQWLVELSEIAEFHGVSKANFADKLGLPLKKLFDPSAIVEKTMLLRGFHILLKHTNDEMFGVGLRAHRRGLFALAIKLATNEKNLQKALEAVVGFNHVCNTSVKIKLILENHTAKLRINATPTHDKFQHFMITLALTLTYATLCVLVKKQLPLKAINMQREMPNNAFDYEYLLNNEVQFSQANNELVFDAAWLFSPVQCQYNELKPLLKSPILFISNVQGAGGIIQQVKYILAKYPYNNFPSQHDVANEIRISTSTMQRKLAMENSSFKQVKNELRKQTALFYMQYTSKNIAHIAEKCGYSERSAFVRAFTRWMGMSPSKFERTTSSLNSEIKS